MLHFLRKRTIFAVLFDKVKCNTMQIVNIPTIERTEFGKAQTKAFRSSGSIPVVIYGGENNVHCGVKKNDVKALIYTPEFKLAELEVGGSKIKCMLKDIQFHPVSDEILHIDFQQLTDGVKLKANLPVVCEGTSAGQREGGKLMQTMRTVAVKTTPENLVDKLIVDISALNLGESARVRDLQVSEGIEVMSPGAAPVAIIEIPRALKSAGAAAEKAEAAEASAEAPAE